MPSKYKPLTEEEEEEARELLEKIFGPSHPQPHACAPKEEAEEGYHILCDQGCYHCIECGMPDNMSHEEDCKNYNLVKKQT